MHADLEAVWRQDHTAEVHGYFDGKQLSLNHLLLNRLLISEFSDDRITAPVAR
jgi:hypothetical protein